MPISTSNFELTNFWAGTNSGIVKVMWQEMETL